MAFANLQEFLAMGGRAEYVWTAYGATVLVLLYNLVAPLRRQRAFVQIERRRSESALPSTADTQSERES